MESAFHNIKKDLSLYPTEPGCYLMYDHRGEIFYIGKAKNIKNRLKSYFLGTDTRIFVQYLEHILAEIKTMVVRNEVEALLLERELIKKHLPKFNILLKDDKNYILLKLARPKESARKKLSYPRLEIVRKTKKDGARYFGPYPSANRLRTTVELINKYFGLRTCADHVIENRARPCIQFQIGRCPAPCVFDVPEYGQEVDNVGLFLSGQSQEIIGRLTEKMRALSESEQFESAARVRDQITAVKTSLVNQAVTNVNQRASQDIIGFARRGPHVQIVQMSVRQGALLKSQTFSFNEQPFPDEEVLSAFIHQAYDMEHCHDWPAEILLPLPITAELHALGEAIFAATQKRVHFLAPVRGDKKRLVEIAHKNALQALTEVLAKITADLSGLEALQKLLGLGMVPKRLECMDISLIQGTDPYGSSVVFIDGQPDKSKYRIFGVKTVSGMDDFAMMHEVVSRRLARGIKEGNLPDLLLVDGGKGQLNAALRAAQDNNLLVDPQGFYIAGIAKARTQKEEHVGHEHDVLHSQERLFVPGESEPIILKPHTFERYLVEHIRDEAHRFALTAHRKKRDKKTRKSVLLDIPGVGKNSAIALLKHFGSIHKVRKATVSEIAEVIKRGPKVAESIVAHLQASLGPDAESET
jgi:excinuclease ABC subunit C